MIVLGAGAWPPRCCATSPTAPSGAWSALLDDDSRKHGGAIHDVKVLGPLDALGEDRRRRWA